MNKEKEIQYILKQINIDKVSAVLVRGYLKEQGFELKPAAIKAAFKTTLTLSNVEKLYLLSKYIIE